jgi:hypothetical protein
MKLYNLALNDDKNTLDYQITLSNIGAAYIHLNNPKKALSYILESKTLATKLQDKLGESISINNLATIYRDLGKKDSALYYYNQALSLVDELGSKEEKKTILYNLYELHEQKGELAKAFSYFKQYTKLKDELFNSEKNEFIVETQEKYQATKRLKDLAEMKIKIQKKDAASKKFIFNVVLGSILTLILLSGLLIWFRWKSIQQKNKAKLEIISATMEGEEKQRLKISQEIHDDLGGILGVCRMLFTKSKSYFVDQNKDLFQRIDGLLIQANNRSRAISHDLFSPTLKQFGLLPAIEELISNLKLSNPDLEIDFQMLDFRVDSKLELNCFRICQELFTNTIKYAKASNIHLHLHFEKDNLVFEYQDDGIGFDKSNIRKGIGLNSIDARVKIFKGVITYPNTQTGFSFKSVFPNTK